MFVEVDLHNICKRIPEILEEEETDNGIKRARLYAGIGLFSIEICLKKLLS